MLACTQESRFQLYVLRVLLTTHKRHFQLCMVVLLSWIVATLTFTSSTEPCAASLEVRHALRTSVSLGHIHMMPRHPTAAP